MIVPHSDMKETIISSLILALQMVDYLPCASFAVAPQHLLECQIYRLPALITLHTIHWRMTANSSFLPCSLLQSSSRDATVVLVSFGNESSPLRPTIQVLNGLWRLAATLGARSSFKKLPKRDVMGADIAQLCDLIAEPVEPLALRLSSNLMVGVAR